MNPLEKARKDLGLTLGDVARAVKLRGHHVHPDTVAACEGRQERNPFSVKAGTAIDVARVLTNSEESAMRLFAAWAKDRQ